MARAITIQGVDRLNRKLAAMPDVVKQAIREALSESADEVVAMMKSLVPVDEGELRDSIGWTFGRAPTGSISVGTVGDPRDLAGLRVTIFAGNNKAYYARWVEFGTATHPAQPYFYVAWRALRRRVKGRVTRRMNAAVKRFVNG